MKEVTKACECVPLGGMLKRRAASTLLHDRMGSRPQDALRSKLNPKAKPLNPQLSSTCRCTLQRHVRA